MADMHGLFGSDDDSEAERASHVFGSDSESEHEQQQQQHERAESLSGRSASGSEREGAGEEEEDDEDDERQAAQPSNKELFGDDSDEDAASRHSDNHSEHSAVSAASVASAHNDDNYHSDAGDHHSGSEAHHSDVEEHRSGSEGHHSDVEEHHSGSEAHQSDAEEHHSGSEAHHSDAEEQHSVSEGHHSDAEEPQSGRSEDGRPSDVEDRHSEGGQNTDVDEGDLWGPSSPRSAAEGSDREHASPRSAGEDEKAQESDEERAHSDNEHEDSRRISDTEQHSTRGSDSEDEIGRKPRRTVATHSGSDSDSDTAADKKATVDTLFGDADDISSDSDEERKPATPGRPLDGEDGEQEPTEAPPPETRIEVEIPKVNTDLGNELYFVKLPNFLSVETRPFDPQYYEDEFEDDETMDEEGRTRLKLKVENTIRWRTIRDDDGNEVKESNARFIRWSDGSMSLHLGNEVFDVHKAPLQGDHNHLFIRQGTGLQGQAVFRTKLTFRPHSTDSATHRKMTLSLADRCSKTQKIRILPIAGKDPESQRTEMIKKEEERLRASIRRESQQRRQREKQHMRGLSSNYLESDRFEEEEEEGEEAISLAAIKNRFKGNMREERARIYSSDSDEGSEDDKNARAAKAKKIESDEEGTEEGTSGKRKAEEEEKTNKKQKRYIISDEEEEDEED